MQMCQWGAESASRFRWDHLYAKSFLERYNDIALLADLLGHKNISTTRMYLRKSSLEQRNLINQIVN